MSRASSSSTSRTPRIEQTFCALAVALALGAGTAQADGGGSAPSMPSNPPPTAQAPPLSPEEKAAIARKKAEDTYASAYREVEKAQAEMKEAEALRAAADEKSLKMAGDRDEAAGKRLKKSAARFREVVAVIPEHANAWNMLGYALRMTGDTDGAFQAYWKCLEIDPEHAGAHEYLGEAYLRTGKIEQARGELAWLEKKGAKEAKILAASIAAWAKANPDAAAKASVTPPALETK
jgi:tetratricopeptide (TPR) repeat protein